MNNSKETSLLFSGEAGQGLNSIESLLDSIMRENGLYVFSSKEIMSRIRGGLNTTLLRIAEEPKGGFIRYPEIIFSLQAGGLERLRDRIAESTLIFHDPQIEEAPKTGSAVEISQKEMTEAAGGKLFLNVALAGMACALLEIDRQIGMDATASFFQDKKPEENCQAFQSGFDLGASLKKEHSWSYSLSPSKAARESRLFSGSEAVGAGALAGGMNFIASYPMSPSTGVLTYLAGKADEFGLLVEQAEDEISAINMALGAWYTGARGMVTTSGGGFALMQEGVSLAGVTETPCVIHLAQRPGPGTGLPTRTEQGDLNLALYSGHGDFPRLILAPGSVHQAFQITRKAFDLADKYQIPVFILTDQFLLDSHWLERPIDYDRQPPRSYTIVSDTDYQRYQVTDSGVSPRALPGEGRGFVRVDSDEHDVRGEITEEFEVRSSQVEKRMRKGRELTKEQDGLELYGSEDYKNLLVCWGSNYCPARETIDLLNDQETACLHFSQLYPVPERAAKYFQQAERIINLENNFTGQFGSLLKQKLMIHIDEQILQYNGLPFAVEDIVDQIRDITKRN